MPPVDTPVDPKPPIVVTGAPRTGTTFLGTMLALNRDVSYIYEPTSVLYGMRDVPLPMLYVRRGSHDEDLAERMFADLLRGRGKFRQPDQPAASLLRRTARRLLGSKVSLRYHRDALNPLRRRWLIKDPWAGFASEWLHQRYSAPTVVIVRHPIPTVTSYQRLAWRFPLADLARMDELMADHLRPILGDLDTEALDPYENGAIMWRCYYKTLGTFLDRNPGMIAVRHEDLSAHPVPVLRDLYERLGMRFDARVERLVGEHTRAGNPGEATGDRVHLLRRDSQAVATQWRGTMDPAVRDRIRARTEPESSRWYSDDDW
ncbi:MAG: hypothetical protein QOG80_762 [Pseudonocardiales bacterium]|nr:hypothetical protein [Pseudonocardiales bacterium]